MTIRRSPVAALVAVALLMAQAALAQADVAEQWGREWSRTDFSRATVDLAEIISGGPSKDGIPPIDDPQFVPVGEVTGLAPQEPVLSLTIGEDARAYPLRVMIWHESARPASCATPIW